MTTDQRCRKCGGTEREGSWRGFTGSKRGQRTNWFCYYGGEEHEFDPIPDQPTPTSSLEEARLILFEAAAYGGPLGEQVDRLVAAARAEVIREVEALQARVKVLEDGLYRTKARAERHMKGPDAYYGIAMECEKALRALSQGGEGKSDG